MICPLRLDIAALGDDASPPFVDEALLKRHVRVSFVDDDDLIDVYLRAAIRWCENATQRTIFRRAHAWVLRDFNLEYPCDIRLPRGKAQSVTSIVYSSNGIPVTLTGPSSSPAGADYQEDLRSEAGGVVMPVLGGSWPGIDHDAVSPVVINFVAGWASDDVPEDLIHAIMFAVDDAYDLRGTSDFNPALLIGSGPRLATREALISSYRLTRVY